MSATNVRAPYGISAVSTNFNYECRKYSGGAIGAETTHITTALADAHWTGKWVGMLAVGGNCHFAFSNNASAELDRTVAATEAGATARVGEPLLAGVKQYIRLPYYQGPTSPSVPSTLFFTRESDAVGTVVYMWLSDESGLKTQP